MSQKKRSVILSNTVYEWLEVLVSTGEYSDLNDAATYLLMQVKRGTPITQSQTGAIQVSTTPVLTSTTPVLSEAIESSPPVPMSTPPVLAVIESPEDELSRLRSLKPMEKMKHSTRIEQLKAQLGA